METKGFTNESRKKGIISMMTASCSFALMATMVKLSGGAIPLFQQVFFRNLIMIIFVIFMMKKEGVNIAFDRATAPALFMRCFFGFLGVICVFYASNHLQLAEAQTLQKLNPFFVTFFAGFILKEKISWKRVLTVIGGFAGAAIVINPSGGMNAGIFPFIVGICSALFGGLAYTMVGKMAGAINGLVIIFYFSAFSTICSIPLMIPHYVAPTQREWIYLLLIGVFAAGGQYFITRAYTCAEASRITLFDYTGVVLSPLIGFFVFGETLKISTLIGMAVIILFGYISSRLED